MDVRGKEGKAAARRNWLAIAQIIATNANPVVGVWFLGWQPLRPIFFYWLDGLLAIWGLGVGAAVVTSREKPKNFGASGAKLWLIWVAVIGLIEVILALPSVFAALFVLNSLHRDVGEVMREVFTGPGIWFSLAVVVWSYAGQTIGELRVEAGPDSQRDRRGPRQPVHPPHPRDGHVGLLGQVGTAASLGARGLRALRGLSVHLHPAQPGTVPAADRIQDEASVREGRGNRQGRTSQPDERLRWVKTDVGGPHGGPFGRKIFGHPA